jgi:hypothetical protein
VGGGPRPARLHDQATARSGFENLNLNSVPLYLFLFFPPLFFLEGDPGMG